MEKRIDVVNIHKANDIFSQMNRQEYMSNLDSRLTWTYFSNAERSL